MVQPPGVPGVLKDVPGSTKHAIWGLVNIAPKLKNIRNTLRKQCFFDILMIFRSVCLLGAILAQELNSFICNIFLWIFWHPWDPGGASI